ncbi:Starch-binding associating with outer membrane [Arenibacter nanhaiticus]|uniref:Starch-binding associating with outer membrane n=1 Tax=Arenibacter nanhaiticus TaxID=558155 RepID=A0A1M6C9M2_9FLAO|nr:SusD/RagB family nutrient-binding outer membrane lipoprotein [Arenibacter nanhaiticus]SHI57501.1 Starch-binding associating with outer membrane [Arenibacter nanhaiticus]
MKKIRNSIVLLFGFLSISSCMKYDDLRENPNDPVSVPPSLLFTSVVPKPISAFTDSYSFAQYHIRNNSDGTPVDYRFGNGGFNYGYLRDINKMVEESEKSGAPVYAILAKFLKAYYYIDMSRELGDVPLVEAMKGADNPQPKYDTQKSVYEQSLNWLNEANLELGQFIGTNPTYTLDGDFYYNGNLRLWQKAINSYTLRVLVSLSKRANDGGINVAERFANIINNPNTYPLMASSDDNMQIIHQDKDGFRGPYNPDNAAYRVDIVLGKTYIDLLKNNKDPRLFKVADPTPNALAANPDEAAVRADFNAYEGADIAASTASNSIKRVNGDLSYPNEERFWNYVGQPAVFLGYSEQELNIAEAAHRGWISNNPKVHYDNGVSASMEYYGVTAEAITNYLTLEAPYVAGAQGLQRIHEQMYLVFAENSRWEGFFLNRRTGVPQFAFSSENNVEKLPLRWAYPSAEDSDNRENYRAALRSQFGNEIDDRDQVMWLIQD